MKKQEFTETQIIKAIKEYEAGKSAIVICREIEVYRKLAEGFFLEIKRIKRTFVKFKFPYKLNLITKRFDLSQFYTQFSESF